MVPGVSIISDFPVSYWLAAIVLGSFAIEAGIRIREKWSVPALMVYLTVFGWYMVEPIISSEMRDFTSEAISGGYICVLIFVCAFRLFCTPIAKAMAPRESMAINARDIPVETVLIVTTVIWLVLLAYGTARMDGDLFAALFPVEARSGNSMWLRAAGADAGKLGFVVSVAGYMYTLVLSLFGMVLPILKRRSYQILCILLILISWPYAFLQGSRNIALAVFIPMVFSFVFFSKIRLFIKALIAICAAFFLEWSMRQIIAYRNFGFDYSGEIENNGHSGLNMATELIYCRSFVENEVLQKTYGSHILADMLNFIPRVIWTDKPLLGIDYAIARGYGGGHKRYRCGRNHFLGHDWPGCAGIRALYRADLQRDADGIVVGLVIASLRSGYRHAGVPIPCRDGADLQPWPEHYLAGALANGVRLWAGAGAGISCQKATHAAGQDCL